MKTKQSFITAIINAFNGIYYGFHNERNLKIQGGISFLCIVAGIIFNLNTYEWILTLLCITGVITTELLNTCLELLCDFIEPKRHPIIGRIKDISAGAVLFSSIISCIIGSLIFLSKINHILYF